jgi:hypothetical protein
METIKEYIEELKNRYKTESYYKAMQLIDMDRQSWTKIQKGSGISDKNAIKLAQKLKIDPLEIMAVSNALKAETNEVRDVWLRLAKEKKEARQRKKENE